MSVLIWVQTVCKINQQTTKVATSNESIMVLKFCRLTFASCSALHFYHQSPTTYELQQFWFYPFLPFTKNLICLCVLMAYIAEYELSLIESELFTVLGRSL